MGNTGQTRRRSSSRKAKAEAQTSASVRAADDEAAINNLRGKVTSPPKPTKTRKEQREDAKAAAELQADKDGAATPSDLEITMVPGRTLSLHEQNLMARAASKGMRDIARDAANAAGKAAYGVLQGKKPKNNAPAARYKRVGQATDSIAKVAAQAAVTAGAGE